MSSPIEEIKKRVDIVDLIGSYIRLSKAGANFKAVCPFHNEKTPSFYVSPAREIFHCFGCNAGGDVFRFVSMIEGVQFPEALEILASRAGVAIKREDPRLANERKRLLQIVSEAAHYYEEELSKNRRATDYLAQRGVSKASLKSFRLGFAPDSWDGVLNHLKQKGYKAEEAEKAGLAILSNRPDARAKYYDRFRSRVMFPISDASGRIVGFSGRIFDKETNEGKYINTPNTSLYDKSKILYLWDRAKNDIRRENSCIVVEGQMDALMSHQAGVANVVATSGTALGNWHMSTIKRLASEIFFTFDADEAGDTASRRAFDLAFESLGSGFDVKIVEVPHGKDPADTIKENPLYWKTAVQTAKPVLYFFLDRLKKKYPQDMPKLGREVRESILPYVVHLKNEIDKARYVQDIAKFLEMREESLWLELKNFPRDKGAAGREAKPVATIAKSRRQLVEERIVGMLKWKGAYSPETIAGLKDLFSRENLPILLSLSEGRSEFEQDLERLSLEVEILWGDSLNFSEELKKLTLELEREVIKDKLANLSNDIRKIEASGEKDKLAEHLKEFQEISKKLNDLWQKSKLGK